jgi:integration host factor subunit alpha
LHLHKLEIANLTVSQRWRPLSSSRIFGGYFIFNAPMNVQNELISNFLCKSYAFSTSLCRARSVNIEYKRRRRFLKMRKDTKGAASAEKNALSPSARAAAGASAGSRASRTITRADVLEAVYVACPQLSRVQARAIFEMALEEIADSFERNEAVKLRSFGSFSVRSKRERIGRNPKTGVEAAISPRRVVTFKPSPVLIALVNGQSIEGLDENE